MASSSGGLWASGSITSTPTWRIPPPEPDGIRGRAAARGTSVEQRRATRADDQGLPRARIHLTESLSSRRAGRDEVGQGVDVLVDDEDLRRVGPQRVVLGGARRL